MKKTIFLVAILLCTSCSIIFPKHFNRKSASFSLQDLWFTSSLDYNDEVTYLINPTQNSYKVKSTDSYNNQLITFFKKELKQQALKKDNYKDLNGKILIPFSLDYDLSQEYKANLKKSTNLDYVILSKVLSANQINNSNYPQYKDLKYGSNLLAGSVVFFKIIDIKHNSTALEIRCKSAVYDNLEFNFETNSYEDDGKIATFSSEEQLIKKCFKRIFKRIK